MARPKQRFAGIPLPYAEANLYNGMINPSTIHVKDTSLFYFFWRFLYYKVASAFDIEGQPEYWDNDYLKAVLICRGYSMVFDYLPVGPIPQNCFVSNTIDIFYRPRTVTIANPAIKNTPNIFTVGEDCELIKFTPDYRGLGQLISFYAENMALCAESAGVNLVNSQLAFVFRVKNEKQAAAFKEMFDKIRSGDAAAWVDKELFDDDEKPTWEAFNQDLRSTFIAPDILEMLTAWEVRFKEEIGIPDIDGKKERRIRDEVQASISGADANITTWIECLNKSLVNVNKMFNLNLRAVRNYSTGGDIDNEQFSTIDD